MEIPRSLLNALRIKYDEVAVKVTHRNSLMVKIWNSEPSVAQTWRTADIELRLAKGKRVIVLEYSSADPASLLRDIERLGEVATRIEETELYAPLPEPSAIKYVEGGYDEAIVKSMEDPSGALHEMIDGAVSNGAERVAGMLQLTEESVELATSSGFEGSEKRTWVKAYLRAFRGDFSGHWAHGSTKLNKEELRRVGEKAAYYATITSERVKLEPGRYDVALSPLVVGNLTNYVAFMSSALYVLMGYSMFMKYPVGARIGSERVSIFDRPRDPSLPEVASFDDEGVETADKPIIEGGVVRNLLHNAATSSKFGAKPTGNAGWISPHPWNLEVAGGDLREDEVAQYLGNGVIITNNWYTRLQNYVEGQFSTVSRDAALLVKNGEVVGSVDRVRISETFPSLLSNIENATRERYDIYWWEVRHPTRAPYWVARNIMLTKPEI